MLPLMNINLTAKAYRRLVTLTAYRNGSQSDLLGRIAGLSYGRSNGGGGGDDGGGGVLLYVPPRFRSVALPPLPSETVAALEAIAAEHLVVSAEGAHSIGATLDAILAGHIVPVGTTLEEVAGRPTEAYLQEDPGDPPYVFYLSSLARRRLPMIGGTKMVCRWLNRVAEGGLKTEKVRETVFVGPRYPYRSFLKKPTLLWLRQEAERHDFRPNSRKTLLAMAGKALEALGQGAIEVAA